MTARVDSLVGHTLAGRYIVRELLSEEELGNVYAASDAEQQGLVNLKVLHPHLLEHPEHFARFGREMLATAAIEHPHTVGMLDFGDHRGVFHFIVLEYIEGRSLRAVMEEGLLPPDRVALIAAQIARALSAAHAGDVVHRNLCPANVVLVDDAQDYVKVRDFGFARLQDPDLAGDEVTDAGSRVGTVGYMAPEYIGQARVDPRGDLYALGILMYEMLTGRPPFQGAPGLVLEQHLHEAPKPPSGDDVEVPDWMEALILDLLAKAPEDRPKDGLAVLRRLQEGMEDKLQPPPRGSRRPVPSVEPETPEPDTGAGWAVGVVGMAAAAFAVGVLVTAIMLIVAL